ncbi:hypothetical protein ACYX78_06415 [Advenella incenata]
MSTQYRKALRLLSIGFSPLSVLWKVQAARHDKRRDQQQHADADRSAICGHRTLTTCLRRNDALAQYTLVRLLAIFHGAESAKFSFVRTGYQSEYLKRNKTINQET